MTFIIVETDIQAPIELCFDLARDVEAHVHTSSSTQERVVGGRVSGLLELGETVTFEATHFGVRQRLTSRITEIDRPLRFVDEMVRGAFVSLKHVHEFTQRETDVWMKDTLTWRSPFGPIGMLVDALFLRRYMLNYLVRKQKDLKELAEQHTRGSRSAGGYAT